MSLAVQVMKTLLSTSATSGPGAGGLSFRDRGDSTGTTWEGKERYYYECAHKSIKQYTRKCIHMWLQREMYIHCWPPSSSSQRDGASGTH